MAMRSSNPALNANTFRNMPVMDDGHSMTLGGAVNCTAILLALVVAAAGWTWHLYFMHDPSIVIYAIGGSIAAFVAVLVACFKKEWSPVLAPIYAICEGLALGAISAMYEQRFDGITIQAVGLTFSTMLGMLLLYKTKIIKPTENFKLGVVAATGGIAIFYLISWGLSFFGMPIPLIGSNGPWGIGFTVFVVIIAALNLVLDFDFIESGAEAGVPKYMEWFAALGLMVTLVWLYIEFLRLLSKLNSRR